MEATEQFRVVISELGREKQYSRNCPRYAEALLEIEFNKSRRPANTVYAIEQRDVSYSDWGIYSPPTPPED